MPRSSRRLPLLAGIACLFVVMACAMASWKQVVALYHVHRLRGEPGYLREILDRPEGTAARLAVRKYLKSEQGKDALFCLFLEHPWVEDVVLPEMARPGAHFLLIRLLSNSCSWTLHTTQRTGRGGRFKLGGALVGTLVDHSGASHQDAFSDLLGEITGKWRTFPEHPELLFKMASVEDAARLGWLDVAEGTTGYVCAIEPMPAVAPVPGSP